VPVTDAHQDSGPDRSAANEEAMACDAVEQQEYSRPRAFFVGPATTLVRGGFFGKASDGYSGYYMEP
jgi:hypothetical protein